MGTFIERCADVWWLLGVRNAGLPERYRVCSMGKPADRQLISQELRRYFGDQHTIVFMTTPEAVAQAAQDIQVALKKRDKGAGKRTAAPPARPPLSAQPADLSRRSEAAALGASVRDERIGRWKAAADAWGAWGVVPSWETASAWDLSYQALVCVGAAEQGDRELFEHWLPLFKAFEAGAWLLFLHNHRISVATLPEVLRTDERGRLHCEHGPALAWMGRKQYRWHGTVVPERVILQPETLTADEIARERNPTLSQVMIERYGTEQYRQTALFVAYLRGRYEAACTLTLAIDRTEIVSSLRRFYERPLLPVLFLDSSDAIPLWLRHQLQSRLPSQAAERFDQQLRKQAGEATAREEQGTREFWLALRQAYALILKDVARQPPIELWRYARIPCEAAAGASPVVADRFFRALLPLLEAFEAGAFLLYPADDGVLVITRPEVVRVDERRRLHGADGPAFVWQAHRLYFWHGQHVSEKLIGVQSDAGWCRLTARLPPDLIEQISPEQQALLPVYASKWTAIRSSTAPAQRAQAEEGVRLAYAAAGLSQPREIIWAASPQALAAAYLDSRPRPTQRERDAAVVRRVSDLLKGGEHLALGKGVKDTLLNALTTQRSFRPYLEAALSDHELQLWAMGAPTPAERAATSELHEFGAYYRHRPADLLYGQHADFPLAWRDYGREVLGLVAETEPTLGPLLIARAAGWWLPGADTCWISDRPCRISWGHREGAPNGELHRSDGPAIEYRDGWGAYCWHGVVVPEHVVLLPELITLEEIAAERDVARHQVLIERFGERRYFAAGGGELLHEDEFGALYQCLSGGQELWTMLRVRNTTPEPDGSHRIYWLRVPDHMRTAREALAWTFGMTAAAYRPSAES